MEYCWLQPYGHPCIWCGVQFQVPEVFLLSESTRLSQQDSSLKGTSRSKLRMLLKWHISRAWISKRCCAKQLLCIWYPSCDFVASVSFLLWVCSLLSEEGKEDSTFTCCLQHHDKQNPCCLYSTCSMNVLHFFLLLFIAISWHKKVLLKQEQKGQVLFWFFPLFVILLLERIFSHLLRQKAKSFCCL